MNISVAVIIVNWNAGATLEKCLTAIKSQTTPAKRIVLVDNASSDNSADGIEERHPGVEVLRQDKNLGFAEANNIAVRHVDDCDYVVLLNPDAYSEPDWLENLLKAADENRDHAFFASRTMATDEPDVVDGAGDAYHVSGRVWRIGYRKPLSVIDPVNREVFSPCGAAAMYKRDDYLAVGGMDQRYFCYVEDVDIGFRLRLRGHKCLYVHNAVAFHEGSVTTGLHSDFYIYHGQRNSVYTFVKNMPWPLFIIYLPQFLLLNLAAILYFTLKGRPKIIFTAKIDAIKGLRKILETRSTVQKGRKASVGEIWRSMERGIFRPYSKNP